ncbi:type II secretion system protein G [Anaerohalosphaera lusitana]|uniref:Type II secretion system protein G n=1 Tax=Anaerohalosphaera lusitana TaxID=1936003 RepID=A0A1U9NN80_9BACT|nr:type II secretion system protein [Anaerohalosphaera lusitana]AQT69194.1 type II secretion system protein G [Anaerohalosphaera lusitana]
MRVKRAFTLIELLVVISIIALLLAIMMPALGMVKEKAKSVVCKSQLRQMAIALQTYAGENNGKAPDFGASYGADPDGFWFVGLAPYLAGDDPYEEKMEILTCPSTKVSPDNGTYIPGTDKNGWVFQGSVKGSYGINFWVMSGSLRGFSAERRFQNFSSLRGGLPTFADSTWPDGHPDGDDQVPLDVYGGGYGGENINTRFPGSMGYGMGRFCIDRHGMAINVAMTGGSVETVDLEDLWVLKWNQLSKPNYDIVLPTGRE